MSFNQERTRKKKQELADGWIQKDLYNEKKKYEDNCCKKELERDDGVKSLKGK